MMNIQAIDAEQASHEAKPTLEMLSKKMGRIPNMYQVMANSP
ncbi:hypothetical protein [Flavobacterium sp. Root420]|jgi:hypothetical protein|nr:hypothetical protein [Flavobacterium sp. Root420]